MAGLCALSHLPLLATVAALGLTGCTSAGSDPTAQLSPAAPRVTSAAASTPSLAPATSGAPTPSPAPTATPSRSPTCASVVSHLSVSAQVGQLLMVAVSSTHPGSADLETVADVRAGSVILLRSSTLGVAGTRRVVKRVRGAARPPQKVGTMLAVDQEGGLVQRLKGPGFSTVPSAQVQATWSDTRLAKEAATWGAQLAEADIDADLGPVADVVPAPMVKTNQPIGRLHRGYGSSPHTVARKVAAFDRGMDRAEILTAAKHFPGLGRVRGNTDVSAHVVDTSTTRHDTALAGFSTLARAGIDMLMVSSASYAAIDRSHRAVFSTTVISGMVRGDLGFTGVVISDDLSAAALRDVTPGDRVVRFLRAGGDLAIVGNPHEARRMASALTKRAEHDHQFAARVAQSAGRVVAMKTRAGRASCATG